MPQISPSIRRDYDTTTALRCALISDIPAADFIPGPGVPLTLTAQGWKPAVAGDTVYGFSSRQAWGDGGPFSDPVTCYGNGVRFTYTDGGLIPGQALYLTYAPGILTTEAEGNGAPVAYALTTTDIITTGGLL